MRYFADPAARRVHSTDSGVIAATFVADGRYDEITCRRASELLQEEGWTPETYQPSFQIAVGAFPRLR